MDAEPDHLVDEAVTSNGIVHRLDPVAEQSHTEDHPDRDAENRRHVHGVEGMPARLQLELPLQPFDQAAESLERDRFRVGEVLMEL